MDDILKLTLLLCCRKRDVQKSSVDNKTVIEGKLQNHAMLDNNNKHMEQSSKEE